MISCGRVPTTVTTFNRLAVSTQADTARRSAPGRNTHANNPHVRDTGTPILEEYENRMPFKFTGNLERVTIELK